MRRAPWPDFAGNPIHEGDTIRHPHSGESGVVVFLPMYPDPGDAWRVNYGDQYESRLCLQIDNKGMAVVVPATDLPTPKGTTVRPDQQIKFEVQAKGLTAPRVTTADIEACIVSEHYFTASAAAFPDVNTGRGQAIPYVPVGYQELSLLTFCAMVLRNGHLVTGESYCADQAKYNAETGRIEARKVAIEKLWPMVIYGERQRLHEALLDQKPAHHPV